MEIVEPRLPAASDAPGGIAPFPDFFVVGAPRCGTTALSRYLSQHPQVCFSKPKEPHYFARIDARHLQEADWSSEYARFFAHHAHFLAARNHLRQEAPIDAGRFHGRPIPLAIT